MRVYLRLLGLVLIGLGIGGTLYFAMLAGADEAYFRAARALEKYPNNVLYQTEFKMAEPRHMLLLMGAWAAAPGGIVLGSICLGLSAVLGRTAEPAGY